ncbi:hypothetical protein V6Z12_A04G157100 [Gossypium hirsutum]
MKDIALNSNLRPLALATILITIELTQSAIFHIYAASPEQFVTLEIPTEWKRTGYTHIHFGAIRLALNYHGTAGKPVVARIALLDSRYLEYQNACIATIEATLNSGLVMVTLFLNFTVALADPNLTKALKVQIQIAGAPQVASAISATLHYQIVYRIQDHAFNLSRHRIDDSLLISVNTNDQPHCVHFDHSHLHSSQNPNIFPTQLMIPSPPPPKSSTKSPAKIPKKSKPFPQPCYKKINKWVKKNPDFFAPQKPISTVCMMQPAASYDKDFPPLEEYSKKSYTHAPKIPLKIQTDISGAPSKISAAEATLNWQTENTIAQNHVLKRIDSKISIVETKLDDNPRYISDGEKTRKKTSLRGVSTKISSSKARESSDSLDELSKESESSSNKKTESEDEELQKAFQTTKVEEPSDDEMQDMPESSSAHQRQMPKSSIGRTTFTIDDLPPAKWSDRIQEFHSWLETRKFTEDSNYNILMEFVSRFTGMLKDWWNSINQHDQMQFLVLQDLAQPIRIIHQYFVGNPQDLLTLKRREFYKRKCCSYVKRDLEKHFKIMTKVYCALGLNPNLKQVILSSLPNPIQVAVNQALQTQNKDILQITVRELQQEVFVALKDICNRRMIFKDYLHGDKRIDRACDDSHLKYKCPKDHLCDCRTKKKKHFKKHSSFPTSRRRKKVRPRWRYLKKKRKSTKFDRCYICNQKGHFQKTIQRTRNKPRRLHK